MSRDAENFLSRWSQRKRAAREQGVVEDAESPVEPAEAEPEKTDAEILEELGLKDPDEMTEGDDFSGFMSGAIPERLRNRALRKLWLTNPVLANLDELVDYGEDFTDAATVVENLQTAYRVGKGFLRQEEIDAAKAAAGEDDSEAESGEDGESEALAEAEATPDVEAPEDAEVAFSPDGSSAESGTAVEPAADTSDETVAVALPEQPATPETIGIPRPRRMVFRAASS